MGTAGTPVQRKAEPILLSPGVCTAQRCAALRVVTTLVGRGGLDMQANPTLARLLGRVLAAAWSLGAGVVQ